jgi:hypothetical protein
VWVIKRAFKQEVKEETLTFDKMMEVLPLLLSEISVKKSKNVSEIHAEGLMFQRSVKGCTRLDKSTNG